MISTNWTLWEEARGLRGAMDWHQQRGQLKAGDTIWQHRIHDDFSIVSEKYLFTGHHLEPITT